MSSDDHESLSLHASIELARIVERGNVDEAARLMTAGRISANAKFGDTPLLYFAAGGGQLPMLQYLLSRGASVKCSYWGQTPLFPALQVCDLHVVCRSGLWRRG